MDVVIEISEVCMQGVYDTYCSLFDLKNPLSMSLQAFELLYLILCLQENPLLPDVAFDMHQLNQQMQEFIRKYKEQMKGKEIDNEVLQKISACEMSICVITKIFNQ